MYLSYSALDANLIPASIRLPFFLIRIQFSETSRISEISGSEIKSSRIPNPQRDLSTRYTISSASSSFNPSFLHLVSISFKYSSRLICFFCTCSIILLLGSLISSKICACTSCTLAIVFHLSIIRHQKDCIFIFILCNLSHTDIFFSGLHLSLYGLC